MNINNAKIAPLYDISVVICSYKPRISALIKTIRSIMVQEGVRFQIIVADDGSEYDCFDEIRSYFITNSFKDYKFIKSTVNVGTVKNYINGINAAESEYIKPISPGDYLYDCYTLRDICNFLLLHDAQISFGNAVYYANDKAGLPELINARNNPQETELFGEKYYNIIKIKKQYLLNDDLILGATVSASKEILLLYLKIIQDKVIYAEDYMFRIMVADKVRIWHMDQYVVWYEYGTGISTVIDKANNWHRILVQESVIVFNIIKDIYPHDRVVKQALRLHKLIAEDKMSIYRLYKLLILPWMSLKSRTKKAVMANSKNVNMNNLTAIYENDGER